MKNTGGPVFPGKIITGYSCVSDDIHGQSEAVPNYEYQEGMALRDYFAGQILSGFYAGYIANENLHAISPEEIAKEMYEVADAMLKEREK